MIRRTWNRDWLQVVIGLVAVGGSLFYRNIAVAQIVPDSTLGAESSVVTPNIEIKGVTSDRIDGGAIRGSGLFHSFQEFNVGEGRGAYFSNPVGVENIFSRVTGTNASNIFGKLGVLGNANLFLLNPNGILFGPNASLDIKGSFSASTANSLNFGDGKLFSATNPAAPPLLSVTVPLGVQFNQQQPKAIANSGNLAVGAGQNLTLLGGTVASTGQLSAPSGQVAIAAVPGGSVVNLSPLAQLLNIETSSPTVSVGSSSLSELLTSVDAKSHPGLTVNGNGQVELSGSSLSVVDGDVVARNVTAQTATLTANNNLTLVESQIGTTGDLNLLAGNTVRVRDSVANPFVAQAGGQLLVQGKQGVDIFALSHPSSGLVSGRDMVLRSANTVGGDAYYWTGGSFRIEKLDGSLGGLFSPYDPIIRARGNVSFQRYEGASLHILAGGSVTITNDVVITGTTDQNGNPTNALIENEPLELLDGTTITIDGTQFPTLDIRAGTTAFDPIGRIPNPIPEVVGLNDTQVSTGANIQIGSISVQGNPQGTVFLTNRYRPSITEGSIIINPLNNNNGSFSISAPGDLIVIDSKGDVLSNNGVNSSIENENGGDIRILSVGNINISDGGINNVDNRQRGSIVSGTNSGNGGNITLNARGEIKTGLIVSRTDRGQSAGDVTLTAGRNITTTGGISSIVNGNINNTSIAEGGNITLNAGGEITVRGNISSLIARDVNGNGGTISLDAGGNLTTAEVTSLVGSGGIGNGGNIILTSRNGIIKTTDKIISVTPNGKSGDIRLNANGNIIIENEIASRILDVTEQQRQNTPRAGNIEITSNLGNIILEGEEIKLDTVKLGNNNLNKNNVDEFVTDPSSNRIAKLITERIILRDITSSTPQGKGGNITLSAPQGDLVAKARGRTLFTFETEPETRAGWSIVAKSENGVAGNVTLAAAGDIHSPNIQASSESNSNNEGYSTIQLNSLKGSVFLSKVQLRTDNEGASNVAGDIIINAAKNIEITGNRDRDIATDGYFGRIFLNAVANVSITNSELTAQASNLPKPEPKTAPQAGDIQVTSGNGNIDINNSSLFTSTGSRFATAGKISLIANQGIISVNNSSNIRSRVLESAGEEAPRDFIPTITFKGNSINIINSQVNASTSGIGNAGDIDITARDTTTFDRGLVFATVEAEGIGEGGDINITTDSLSMTKGAELTASTFGQGNAGNVIINARDTVSFDNANAFTKVEGNFQTQDGHDRQGGDIKITTGLLSVSNDAQLQALTEGRGNAGNVIINARDRATFDRGFAFTRVARTSVGKAGEIRISIPNGSLSLTNGAQLLSDTAGQGEAGKIVINARDSISISGTNPNSGRSSALFTDTESASFAGDITIGDVIKPNLFRISDGAVLVTSTSSTGNAGNITVNANRFEAINGGQLIAKTTSSGAAGTITVKADRRVTVGGRDTNFANRRSNFGDRFVANEITDSEVFSGLFVRSSASGQAGNIEINSPIVLLDNQGRLDANSNSQPGGNITLNQGNLLLLRRNSLITTNAGSGNGGNIEIQYPKGFVIAGFGRNNDIVANAFTGAGGKVTINALGAVNIQALKGDELERRLRLSSNTSPEKLDPQELLTNDITAISQAGGPNLQGTVNLNAPNVDPTRGTIQLPEDLGDSSRLIAQSCPVGVQGAASRFVVTGRGGLPPNPGSALSTDTFLGSAANASSSENATTSTSLPPQEAQGVEIGSRGEIILTARPSTLTPRTPWQRLTDCYGK